MSNRIRVDMASRPEARELIKLIEDLNKKGTPTKIVYSKHSADVVFVEHLDTIGGATIMHKTKLPFWKRKKKIEKKDDSLGEAISIVIAK